MTLPNEPAPRHRSVAEGFSRCVRAVSDWEAPSPVAAWTARDVVAHLVDWLPGFLAAGGVTLLPGPDVAEDPVTAWHHHAVAVQDLLEAPSAMAPFRHDRVPAMALAEAVDRFYTADVFMHTWDLGRAAAQEVRLDEDFCAELLDGMEPMDRMLRESGQYGPRVAVPADAPVQSRLVAFIGRDPDWTINHRTP